MKENLTELQKELRKNRLQSYFFLVLMIAGVIYSTYLYLDLQQKKEELLSSNNLLEIQRNQLDSSLMALKNSKASLAMKDSLIQRQKVLNELIASVLSAEDSGEVPADREGILQVLENKKKAEQAKLQAYETERSKLIQDLYSSSEQRRVQARNTLLKQYSQDDQLLPDLLAYSKGKITSDNQESVWQIIYLLEQLDSDFLQQQDAQLNDFFAAAEAAQLVGTSTRARIKIIEKRMKRKS